MGSVTFAIDKELKAKTERFPWVNWSEAAREDLFERERMSNILLKQLNSKQEQELIRWSVELGREAKKGRFERLLREVSPEIRKQLLAKADPTKRGA